MWNRFFVALSVFIVVLNFLSVFTGSVYNLMVVFLYMLYFQFWVRHNLKNGW